MGFLTPWFLAGAAALGVPVFVHLLRRQTTTPQPVSSLMFFEQGTQSSTRHRKLRYLLLFALRTALVALLVLAFANPFVRRANAGASGRLLLVVVDNSYSMREGTRFADAKRGALEVLGAKAGGQRAQVMALGAELQVLTQPVQDAGTLRAAVEGIQQGDSKGNFGELGHGLRALAETVHTPVELHLFSDMQKTEMPGNFADMVLPGNVKLVLHPVGSGVAGPNWTVESVSAPAQLADPKDKRRSRVEAVVAGFGTPAVAKMVSLLVNGRTIATKRVDVPANGRVKVELEPLDVPYGFSRCEVRVGPVAGGVADAFPADDGSVFSVRRSDPERVAFVHGAGDGRSALYFGAALGAAAESSFVLQPVNVEQSADVDPTRYAFVVLSDVGTLPSILENSLTQYVKGGGSVLVAAGTSSGRRGKIPVLGADVLDGKYYSRDAGDGFAKVAQVDGTHAVIGDGSDGWTELKVFYATRVDAAKAGARVLVRLGDGANGTPLLMDKALGEGHVVVLASGLENLTNDLPLQPGFVPFVDRAARYLSGEDRLGGTRVVDSFVQLRTAGAGQSGAGVEVVDPEGRRPLSLAEAGSIQSYQLTRSGFYQLRFANGKDGVVGVNPDRRESDMTMIPEDVLKLWSGSGGPEGAPSGEIAAKETPMSLWWWVMLLALVAAVAESVVATGYLGTQREEA
ncbi:BatA and WFA domain-containing protein [Granulicella sp. dw_53]|uniref:vWA domain-containing protein n=1 Tax=Granulicella sp. dw_53 TaxID=2719792 RepID=UPI001BD67EF9|nr:BatA and WFA domain-containing protein [Granulicella sp. dw_53]